MKKIFFLLLLTSTFCFAQESYNEVKYLNDKKVKILLYKIKEISQFSTKTIYGSENTADEKVINNFKLFLENPFDKNIENFDLIIALKKLEEVYKNMPILSSNEMSNGNIKGGIKDISAPIKDKEETERLNSVATLAKLTSAVPTGYSMSTQVIDAISQFLVERTKQELTLTFYENFKTKLNTSIPIKIDDKNTIKIELKKIFSNTYTLFESKNYFETPSLGETWILSFKKDLNELPFKMEDVLRSNAFLKSTEEGHFAIVSFDIIKKLKKGEHPIFIIEDLNEKYNITADYDKEIDQIVSLLQLFSENVTTQVAINEFKEIKWVTTNELKSLDETAAKYLTGLIYQKGRNTTLFKKMKHSDGKSIEDLITKDNYKVLQNFIKKTLVSYNTIDQKLTDLKTKKEKDNSINDLKQYTDFLNTFYGLFDETLENYYTLVDNDNYYQSNYYTKYKPIITDIIDFNAALSNSNHAECLLLTNRFLNHLLPNLDKNNKITKEITFYGNFMVDVINTAENKGDLKLVLTNYAMQVSSYRIKRSFNSSWDVSAYPGLYLGYEFSESKSLSYGVTAPIGCSYSFKNNNTNNNEVKSSSSSVFLSVIDIGAPFSYRFTNDEAEGLPENIKWEQVFAPGLFYIYGFANSPLSIGLNAQLSPLLRKIDVNNELDSKNIFRIGLSLLVDIPLFNLSSK